MLVVKRDGSEQKFNSKKIERAVGSVLDGMGSAKMLTDRVVGRLLRLGEASVSVSDVQAVIEAELIDSGFTGAARDYISYRAVRDSLRAARRQADVAAFGASIIASKYTRSGETWENAVDRMMDMHISFWKPRILSSKRDGSDEVAEAGQRWGDILELIEECRAAVKRKEIVGSMRALQMGGEKILKHNDSMFNCSFTHISNFANVQKAFFRLLCGCGVGYSVQLHHVAKLPRIIAPDKDSIVHHSVEDTIEGWADALGMLLSSYTGGGYVEFNYSNIRPAGSRLRTTGGTAPGHMGLRDGLDNIRRILDSVVMEGGRLRPIHMHDIMCYMAGAVLSGGVRRSAMLALFSVNDGEMMMAKSPGHFRPQSPGNVGLNSQREYANNSVAFLRNKMERADFKRVLDSCRNFGEPGFYFTDDLEYGPNPCGEINMLPLTDGTDRIESAELGTDPTGTSESKNLVESGFSFCNLTEINGATCDDAAEFHRRCRLAAVLGTLQAGYTDFGYLDGDVDKEIADRDALLGVSITGIMNNADLLLDDEVLATGAGIVRAVNEEVAQMLGINAAARLTCVKPSGTASKALSEAQIVGSGIHGLWSRRWIQGVTYTPDEDALKCVLRDSPVQATLKPDGNYFVEWPLSVSDSAVTMKDLDALQQLKNIATVYNNWVAPGTVRGTVTHNVSCTVTVRDDDEWDEVEDFIWDNRGWLAALTFVPDLLEIRYPYAPFRAVSDSVAEARYNELISKMKPITWNLDSKNHATDTVACAGGACEI